MCLASESAEEEETRYPDAKVETERGVPHSLRRRRKIFAALKLSVERTDRDRRKRRLDSESAEDTLIQRDIISLIQIAYSHHSWSAEKKMAHQDGGEQSAPITY